MIWSLVKIIVFIALVTALAIGAGMLMETGGGVRITVSDMEFNLQPLQAVIALVALVLFVWLLIKVASFLVAVARFINGDETAISRFFDRNRERKGFDAFSEGMTALAAGEGRLAMAKAARAEKYLGRPELTNLITAQAAEISGDRKKAEEVYKRLLADDRTRFVGIRGIMKQKLEDGDTDLAMKLAEKAFALKPRHEETGDVLLRLQSENSDWKGARNTLLEKKRHGVLPKDVHKRRDAVLALSEAREEFRDGSAAEANQAAIGANRLSPDLVPAAVMAAQAHITSGNARLAAKVLKKAWDAHPHPDLAAAYAAISPDEAPEDRIKRFQKLIKHSRDHSETKMLLAELFIGAEDYGNARSALGDLPESEPTARSLSIMAAIERGDGNEDSVVRAWLAKAVTASRGPQWVCDNCHTVHSSFEAVCSNCGSLDTLSWKVPADGGVAMPASTEMLPLIVGSEDKGVAPDDATDAGLSGELVVIPEAEDTPDGDEEPKKPNADAGD